jgi:hypothetical protein
LTGAGLGDDPLLYTGGGRTEIELDLLFDVELGGSSITTNDVRDLTAPLWNLAESATDAATPVQADMGDTPYGGPPLVRFVWGKSWNIPGVVSAVAERLEQFTTQGVPRRSWLRMRFLRVSEPQAQPPRREPFLPREVVEAVQQRAATQDEETNPEEIRTHEVLGGSRDNGEIQGERLDEIAARYYGDPSLWRLIASFNNIADPAHLTPGMILRIPPLPGGGAAP